MKDFNPNIFLAMIHFFKIADEIFHSKNPDSTFSPLKEEDETVNFLKSLERDCRQAELRLSANSIQKIIQLNFSANPTYRQSTRLVEEFYGRLREELDLMTYFSLTSEEADRYRNPQKEWGNIIERFPAIVMDVEEANKCFALSRYAAAVYHSLQIVEGGLVYLNKFMKSTDPQPGWNAATNDLNRILKTKYEERTDFEKRHSKFFEQMQAPIETLKAAWRNKISHSSERLTLMTSEFHPEIAKDILDATRIFMRRLATDLPTSDV